MFNLRSPLARRSALQRHPVRTGVLVAAVALMAALAQSAWAQEGSGHLGMGHGRAGMHAAGFMQGRMVERMLDQVSATPDQRAQVKRIAAQAAQDVRALRQAQGDLKARGLQLLAAPTVDANAVEAHRLQMMQQHDQVSRRVSQAMVDVSRVLTPEQRQQLAQTVARRQSMMRRHQQERQQLDGLPRS
jgi:periplasmic protein CpxP/Spy